MHEFEWSARGKFYSVILSFIQMPLDPFINLLNDLPNLMTGIDRKNLLPGKKSNVNHLLAVSFRIVAVDK